ncbi:cell division protein ZapA [Psychrobacter frigidicola]|uniref:Cell division protein ZapA n=1 Tax=Psychrobacter frigidicola TaxID=45611 RepID=A0A5C7A000_9GAMM|nr:cell division protein ZapA [Psychrobacter frigidicola]TXD96436.1 cell division protein ZapA [Psychrobacter frigidicola]
MTNDRTDTKNAQTEDNKTSEHNTNVQTGQIQTATPDLVAEPKISDVSPETTEAEKPQMKKVDIVIAGVTYQIYCPVNEEEELRSAVYYINNFVLDIKKDAPNLPQENLLVLCCLNLYEKIHSQSKIDEDQRYETEKSVALLSKIMLDAQSIL